jgi:hypothetical protein
VSHGAFQRAERCFALARSTTFHGERDAAVRKGTKIATDAGLSLDLFDIPGRARRQPANGDRLFEGDGWMGDNFRYVYVDPYAIAEALRRMSEVEAERDRRAKTQADAMQVKIDSAVDFLRGMGYAVKRVRGQHYAYSIVRHGQPVFYDMHAFIKFARQEGWDGRV